MVPLLFHADFELSYESIDMVFLAVESVKLIFTCLLCMGSGTSSIFTPLHILYLFAFGRSGLRPLSFVPVDVVSINMAGASKPPINIPWWSLKIR